jgi:type IV secretion system protein VirB10
MVPEGTTIDTVLQTRLNGSFAGPAKVMVTNPVYDRARQIVLIPAGTILLGDVRAVQKIGEDRLAVTFHRMLRTDGFNADLDTFTGLDQIGETALKDKVNHHYVEVFGVSVALGAIAGLAEMSSGGSSYGSESGQSMYMQGFGQSLDMSAQRILDKYTNILPTVTIREGTRVKVYLTNDIYLPPAVAKPILD